MKKIGLDFDGVITNCAKLKIKNLRKIFGHIVSSQELRKEILLRDYLSLEEYKSFQQKIYETREFGLNLELVEDAIKYIQKLISNNNHIVIITSRDKGLSIAKEWFSSLNLNIDFISSGVGKSKADTARGLDVYIDDDYHKLKPLIGVVPNLFLFSWGYNLHINEGQNIIRVSSWKEFYTRITQLK
ncbi:MAG: hypothetical protein V1851_00285 [Patescibacteria group bacterium]